MAIKESETVNLNLDREAISILDSVVVEAHSNRSAAARYIIHNWARHCQPGILINTNSTTNGNGSDHEASN